VKAQVQIASVPSPAALAIDLGAGEDEKISTEISTYPQESGVL